MPRVRAELFGKMRLKFGDQVIASVNTSRLQSLLACLLLNHNVFQARSSLAFKLWPESSEAQARTNLRQLIHHLRRALPVQCNNLLCDNHAACWDLEDGSLDVVDFEKALYESADLEKEGDSNGARRALERAVGLYKDDLLPDLYDDWLAEPRARYRDQFFEVLARLVRILEAEGNLDGAIRHANRLLWLDPLREPTYEALMRMHFNTGNRSAVLRLYHQCSVALRRELGAAPGEGVEQLYERALNQDAERPTTSLPVGWRDHADPFLGREVELEGACRQVRKGVKLLLIDGEAGIGKSRFAEALLSLLAIRQVARARCYGAQTRLAFGPVSELLRSAAVAPLKDRLVEAQLTELARVLPELLVDDGALPPPQNIVEGWQKRHFFEAVNAALAGAPKPIILFIEDIQWCDPETFEWLSFFLRSKSAQDVMVMATARTEEIGRHHPLTSLARDLRQEGVFSDVSLGPLGMEETADLANHVAGRSCASNYLTELYSATKGNPLFVVETVRASKEKGGSDLIPSRIQAVIEGRLANLSANAFELAELAAAAGTAFSADTLAKVGDWEESSVSKALEELWQRRIIELAPGGNFDFTHVLIRDVAYRGMSAIRCRSFHHHWARTLEEDYGSGVSPSSIQIAGHFERSGNMLKATAHYQNAARLARSRFAEIEAAQILRHALALCRDMPESLPREETELQLLAMLGPSVVASRGYAVSEVGEVYDRALVLSDRIGEREHKISILAGEWLFQTVRGDLAESRKLATRCLREAEQYGEPGVRQAASFLMGATSFHLANFAESKEHLERALPEQGGLSHPALALFAGPDVGVFCRAYFSHLMWHLGYSEQALELSDGSLLLGRELSHPFSLAVALDYAALLDSFSGDAGPTQEHAGEALELCRKYGFVYYSAWAQVLEAWANVKNDRSEIGLEGLRSGLASLRGMGAELRLPYYYALLAEAYHICSRPAEASAALANGFAFANKNGEAWVLPVLDRVGLLLSKSSTHA